MPGTPLEVSSISLKDYKKGAPLNSHQKRRHDLIVRLLGKLDKVGKGLDYGCGLGELTWLLAGHFDEIVGVDVTKERVEWANNEFPPIKFYQCGHSTLDFPNDEFDTVLSSVVINWADDPKAYVMNIHRVLKPGGHIVILVKNADKLRGKIRSLLGKENSSATLGGISLTNIQDLLIECGFNIAHLDCYYDPPMDSFTNPKNIAVEILKIPMRILSLPAYSHYFGIVASKAG